MRSPVILAAVLALLVAPALAQTEPVPASSDAVAVQAEPAPPKEKRIRYVNEKGETLICKPVSGSTGTRLKGRGKLICGTEAEWDDADSQIRQMFDQMITRNTPSPRG